LVGGAEEFRTGGGQEGGVREDDGDGDVEVVEGVNIFRGVGN